MSTCQPPVGGGGWHGRGERGARKYACRSSSGKKPNRRSRATWTEVTPKTRTFIFSWFRTFSKLALRRSKESYETKWTTEEERKCEGLLEVKSRMFCSYYRPPPYPQHFVLPPYCCPSYNTRRGGFHPKSRQGGGTSTASRSERVLMCRSRVCQRLKDFQQ